MASSRFSLLTAFLACALSLPLGASDEPERPSYVIGIEDVLGLVVWDEPELTLDVQVRPDGKITVPLLNDIYVVGLTPEHLGVLLTERLGVFVTDPSVTVIVRDIKSYKVYFLGEVASQGAVTFKRPTRILQGIATAGGLTQFSKKEITLLREVGGVEKRFQIDYKKLVAGDPTQENLLLLPDDTLLFH